MTISRTVHRALLDHAAETPEIEICGLLFGRESAIDAAERAANVAASPERRFEIDPQALFFAVREERGGGRALTGVYHSHPNGVAEPSAHDHAMALDPGRLWLIVTDSEITAWRCEKPGHLAPVELSLVSDKGQRQ